MRCLRDTPEIERQVGLQRLEMPEAGREVNSKSRATQPISHGIDLEYTHGCSSQDNG